MIKRSLFKQLTQWWLNLLYQYYQLSQSSVLGTGKRTLSDNG